MRIKNHSLSLLTLHRNEEAKKPSWSPVASVVLTVVIYFVSQIIGGTVIYVYPAMKGWSAATTESWLRSSVIAQFFLILMIEALTIAAVFFLLGIRKVSRRTIGLTKPRAYDVLYAFTGFGIYFVIYVAIFFVVQKLFPQINLEQKQQIGFESAKKGTDLIWVFMSLVLLPPIAEEILVRGFLYTGLRNKLSVWPAAILTSIIFAAAHLQAGSGAPLLWTAALDTFVLSMVLVYLREKRGSLAAPMMLHMLKNGLAFMLLFVVTAR